MLSNHYAKKRECAYVGSVQRTKSCLVGHRHVQKKKKKKKEEEKISQITSVMKKHAKVKVRSSLFDEKIVFPFFLKFIIW